MASNKDNKKSFSWFPMTRICIHACARSMDRPQMANDECQCCNVRGQEPCCASCSMFATPITFPLDLIFLLPRALWCAGKKFVINTDHFRDDKEIAMKK